MAGWSSSIYVFRRLGQVTEETYLYFLWTMWYCWLHQSVTFIMHWSGLHPNEMHPLVWEAASVTICQCSWQDVHPNPGLMRRKGNAKERLKELFEWCWVEQLWELAKQPAEEGSQVRGLAGKPPAETNQPWWLRWIWMIGMEGLTGDHWRLCPLEAEGGCKDPLVAPPEINEGIEDLLVAVTGRWSCREFRWLGSKPMSVVKTLSVANGKGDGTPLNWELNQNETGLWLINTLLSPRESGARKTQYQVVRTRT